MMQQLLQHPVAAGVLALIIVAGTLAIWLEAAWRARNPGTCRICGEPANEPSGYCDDCYWNMWW